MIKIENISDHDSIKKLSFGTYKTHILDYYYATKSNVRSKARP